MDKKIEFLLKNRKEFTRNLILKFYPFNILSLSKFRSIILPHEWEILAENSNIQWNEELINIFFTKNIYWKQLTINIRWTKELLKIYSDKVIWSSFEFVRYFDQDYTDSEWIDGILHNPYIIWDKEWIDLFQNNIDWDELSGSHKVSWSIDLIVLFKNTWRWDFLSNNESIDYTDELIIKFYDYWDWGWLGLTKSFLHNIELYNKYYHKLTYDGQRMSNTKRKEILYDYPCQYLNYTIEEIYQNDHLINWFSLSMNELINWNDNFIFANRDKFDWTYLALNCAISWNSNLFNIFKNKFIASRINIEHISKEGCFPWSEDFINNNLGLFNIHYLAYNKLVWEVFKDCINKDNIEEFFI